MIGVTVKNYRILDRLGTGGMGVVYRAEDTKLGRSVALKFLPPELSDDRRAKSRFLREARAASLLDHPNICTVHEISETDDGQLFIVMASYSGETLKERMERGPLPVEEAVSVARRVLAGLAKAHGEGVVHRDVKPANLFLTADDQVKILDFGLAKVAGEHKLTHSGLSMGTPFYMAPEQILGETDHRSDLWALGVILYEMLAGRLPFPITHQVSAVQAVLHRPLPDLAETLPSVPEEVRGVIRRALAKSPDERYGDAEEMLAALPPARDSSAATTTVALETPKAGGVRRRVSGVPLPPLLLGALALAVAVGLFVAWAGRRADPPPEPTRDDGAIAVAVLPFEFRGDPDYGYLSEGMVDLLRSKLDGAGDLRTVGRRAVFAQLEERGAPEDRLDPEEGAELVGPLGADWLLMGEVMEVSGQLRLDAALFGVDAPGVELARAGVEGPADGIFGLVDDLASQLLASTERSATARLAARTTESFDALKAYLEGESAFRAGRLADATRALETAVTADPEFAMAWYRLSIVADWRLDFVGAKAAAERAARHRDELSPDDQNLIAALLAFNQGDPQEAERLCREVLRHRPDDLEAWFRLAESEFHFGGLRGDSMSRSRRSWEKILELEPDHAGALIHLARLAAFEGELEELAQLSRRLEGQLDRSEREFEPYFFRALLGGETELGEFRRQLRGTALGVAWLTPAHVVSADQPGWLDRWSSLFGLLLEPGRSSRERSFGHRRIGLVELARGRLASASLHLASASQAPEQPQEARVLAALTPFVPLPDSEVRALLAIVETWRVEPPSRSFSPFEPHSTFPGHLRHYASALLHLRLGDEGSALEAIDALEALGEIDMAPGLTLDLAEEARADLARRRGDPDATLRLFGERNGRYSYELALFSPIFSRARERFVRAEALFALGRLGEARRVYASLAEYNSYDLAYLARSHLRRGEIDEREGRHGDAVFHYRRFLELWAEADAPLDTDVERVRGRLEAVQRLAS